MLMSVTDVMDEPTAGYPESPTGHAFSEHNAVERYFRESGDLPGRAMARWRSRKWRRPTMVDVGAYRGQSFRPFLALGWDIHAFEPDPDSRKHLADVAGEGRITVHETAVADVERDGVPWFVSDEVDSISSLAPFDPSHHRSATVRVTTLARALEEAGVERVDYLKIDAEGFDLQVLRGFPWRRSWRRTHPPEVILCEFEDRKTRRLGYGVDDLGGFLLDRGYRVFLSEWQPIERYGAGHRWRRVASYPTPLWDRDAWGNFIAVRPNGAPRMESVLLDEAVADRTKQAFDYLKASGALKAVQRDLQQRNRHIADLRESIERRDEAIHRLKQTLGDRDVAIERLKTVLRDRDDAIGRVRRSLEQRNQTIVDLRAALDRRGVDSATQPTRTKK